MKTFVEYIDEAVKPKVPSKEMHWFDMDETLFHHDNKHLRIHVKDPLGRVVRTLTNQEYNSHRLPEGHSYDFNEFRSSHTFGKSATPIHKIIAKLKHLHRSKDHVEILTARSDLDDKEKFMHHLRKYGIDPEEIHVRRAGNLEGLPGPKAKAAVARDLISKHGYTKVHLYDDHPDNLKEFLKLQKDHPQVEFHAHHVNHNPETGEVKVTTEIKKAKPLESEKNKGKK